MKRIFLFAALAVNHLSVWSQNKDTSFHSLFLQPVEVIATRSGINAPFTKTDLSKKEIEKSNLGQDLPFLLNQVPSTVINSDAGNGVGYTGLRIRGTDLSRINVTVNGVPYNDAESQGVFFVDLPDIASSIRSIQVQRGVGTSSNGAGAFGATISLSTNEFNEKPYLELNNSFGSFSTHKHTLRFGSGLLHDHFTLDGRISSIRSNGYIDRAKSNLASYFASGAYITSKTQVRLNEFGGKEKTYQAWYGVPESLLSTDRTFNPAGTEKPGDPYGNQTDNYWQYHHQLFINHYFSPELTANIGLFLTNGHGYYEEYKADQSLSDYGFTSGGKSDLVRQLWLDNSFYGNIFSLQYKKSATQLTIGGGWDQYNGNHFGKVIWNQSGATSNNPYYNLDALKTDFNVYGKIDQALLPYLHAFGELQWRTVRYQLDGFRYNPALNIEAKYGFVNPRLGLNYQKNNNRYYLSYARAKKEPNRDDFEAATYEQPKPESLNDFEAGFENKSNKSSYGLTLFYMKYKDQLVLTGKINDVGAYTRTNIPDSYRAGAEIFAGFQILHSLRWEGNLSLSENKIRGFAEYLDDYDNGGQIKNNYGKTDISFSPNVISSSTITFQPREFFEIALLSKYVGSQFLDNTSNADRKIKAYFVNDLRTSWDVQLKKIKLQIYGQLNNFFNVKYAPAGYTYSYIYGGSQTTEKYFYPMAERNFMIGLNVKL